MSREETISRDIRWFLVTNKTINRINFALKNRYKVYPRAYHDVGYAIKGDKIKVNIKNIQGAGAKYNSGSWFGDKLSIPFLFNIGDYRYQALLIHECTHAHLDIQNIGKHSLHENEAVAYIAEAIYLEVLNKPPLSKHRIRSLSKTIAKKVKSGTYWVSDNDANALVSAIANHPTYRKNTTQQSNGVWSVKSWFNPSK